MSQSHNWKLHYRIMAQINCFFIFITATEGLELNGNSDVSPCNFFLASFRNSTEFTSILGGKMTKPEFRRYEKMGVCYRISVVNTTFVTLPKIIRFCVFNEMRLFSLRNLTSYLVKYAESDDFWQSYKSSIYY